MDVDVSIDVDVSELGDQLCRVFYDQSELIIKGSFSLNVIALNSLLMKMASFAVCDRANNSASVLDVVTVPCLFILQAIGPLIAS